ncbi:hypothetical protein AB0C07_22675 [Actinoplanes missouriensis]|uniref:hypothetical protein n=1 Tax=Actinoplanes missouriensis TaxID=1866 RepID=UPI0033DA5693
MNDSRLRAVMACAAVTLVLLSFAPWWVVRWTSMRYGSGQVTEHVTTASAWTASTGWSVGIVLGVIAAIGWLWWPPPLPRHRRSAFAATVAVAAVATTVGTRVAIVLERGATTASYAIVPATGDGPRIGDIVRDSLSSGTAGWGFYAGVVVLLTIAVCALVGRRAGRRSRSLT